MQTQLFLPRIQLVMVFVRLGQAAVYMMLISKVPLDVDEQAVAGRYVSSFFTFRISLHVRGKDRPFHTYTKSPCHYSKISIVMAYFSPEVGDDGKKCKKKLHATQKIDIDFADTSVTRRVFELGRKPLYHVSADHSATRLREEPLCYASDEGCRWI